MEKKLETTTVCLGFIGIMEKKMVYIRVQTPAICCHSARQLDVDETERGADRGVVSLGFFFALFL